MSVQVEKFLSANTVELSKDKWLCPLSGKKFKVSHLHVHACADTNGCLVTVVGVFFQAPEFVRKHILNKHGEKVATVRQEVEFFNNFLLDAKRPALPENKPHPPPAQGDLHI